MVKMQNKQEFVISFRCNAIDMKLVQELASSFEVSYTDILKLALWDYSTSPKNMMLRDSLKELAIQQKKMFEMSVLKEMEYINNRQAFFIDGFRTSLDNYRKKHVPLAYVKRFVLIKLVGLYGVFHNSSLRKNYVKYIEEHFCYCYPSEKKWIAKQLAYVRNIKKNEKDRLLMSISSQIKDNAIDFGEHINKDGDVDSNIMKRLLMPKQAKITAHFKKENNKIDMRLKFYQNKDKYFRGKDAGTK